jgi:hypothetical protein
MKLVEINKWRIEFILFPSPPRRSYMSFSCGIFKLITFPPAGEVLSKKNYKGFRYCFDFRIPEIIFTHNFK